MFNVIPYQYDHLLVYDLHESGDEHAHELHGLASLHDDDVLHGHVRVRVLRDRDCARVLHDHDLHDVFGHVSAHRDVIRHVFVRHDVLDRAFLLHDVLDHAFVHDVHHGGERQLLDLKHENFNSTLSNLKLLVDVKVY